MLSIGWPEMLIIAAAALIVVGPRDLPALLRQIGRVVGQVRRMGNEFKAEINKVAALDDVKDIKRSITQPLADTRSSIEKEFNKMTPSGFEPSGVMKPADPGAESVYDEIKAFSDAPTENPDPGEAARATMAAAVTRAMEGNSSKAAEAAAVAKPAAKPVTKAKARAPGKSGRTTKTAAADAADKPAAKRKGAGNGAGKAGTKTPAKKPATAKTASKAPSGTKKATRTKTASTGKTPAREPRTSTKA